MRYSRYDESDPLAHDTRVVVFAAVDDAPGIYLTELSEQTGVALSTLRHHLQNLEADGITRGRTTGAPAEGR